MFHSSLDLHFKWKSIVSIWDFDMPSISQPFGRCVWWQDIWLSGRRNFQPHRAYSCLLRSVWTSSMQCFDWKSAIMGVQNNGLEKLQTLSITCHFWEIIPTQDILRFDNHPITMDSPMREAYHGPICHWQKGSESVGFLQITNCSIVTCYAR